MLSAEALNIQINELIRHSGRGNGQTRVRKLLCDHSTTFQSSNILTQLKKQRYGNRKPIKGPGDSKNKQELKATVGTDE